MKKKSADLTDDEIGEFRSAVKNVKPLKVNKTIQPIKNSAIKNREKFFFQDEMTETPLSDVVAKEVTGSEELFFAHPGLQQKILRDLRNGKILQSGILDLHGLTVNQARSSVIRFLSRCQKKYCRCVRIIHGKGMLRGGQQPVLKNHVNSWLQQHPDVLAFCTAKARDGGTGAVYVLLKIKKEQPLED